MRKLGSTEVVWLDPDDANGQQGSGLDPGLWLKTCLGRKTNWETRRGSYHCLWKEDYVTYMSGSPADPSMVGWEI